MKPQGFIILVCALFFIPMGCGDRKATDASKSSVLESNVLANDQNGHFVGHFDDAGLFLDLKHKGDIQMQSGNFDEAINLYKEALDKHAYSRPEQAIAASRIAKAYEQKGIASSASKYYIIAASTTMNENQARDYLEKSQKLANKPD